MGTLQSYLFLQIETNSIQMYGAQICAIPRLTARDAARLGLLAGAWFRWTAGGLAAARLAQRVVHRFRRYPNVSRKLQFSFEGLPRRNLRIRGCTLYISLCQRMAITMTLLTRSSTATFRTFHRNSKMAMMKATRQPNARTTKTPPTLSMPNSAVSFFSASSSLQRPWIWNGIIRNLFK